MKKTLLIAACVALASVSTAQKAPFTGATLQAGTGGTMSGTIIPATIIATNSSEAGTDLVIDIGGSEHWDPELDGSNVILAVAVPAGATINGIGWDVTYTSVGASWGSEATFGIAGDGGISALYLTPSSTDDPVISENNSSPVLKLLDVGLADIPATGGTVFIELFDTFDDFPDAVDGTNDAGSTITLQYIGGGPAVPTVTQWGLIVTTVLLFGGVILVSRRRKSAPNAG